MQVQLLKAAEEDKDDIWNLFVPAMKHHIEKIWGWELAWQINEFNNRYFELNTSFLVTDNRKVGYVRYSLNDHDTYLNMVILSPDVQSMGLGKRVLTLIQSLQPEKPLRLRCFHVNKRALSFYEASGFQTIESEEHSVLMERNT